jgi:hypothetical protein
MLLERTRSWMASAHQDRGSLEQTMVIKSDVEQDHKANGRLDVIRGAKGCTASPRRLVRSQGGFQLVPVLDEGALGREMRL